MDETDGSAPVDEGSNVSDDGGYRTVAVSDIPNGLSPARTKKELDEAVGATAFGCNVYEADAGEQLPWGYHRHPDHEELFYVIAGALAVETPEHTYRVGADEAFFVPPDHRNRARAAVDGTRVVAVGAPKGSDGAVIEEECTVCGERTRQEAVRVEGAADDSAGETDDGAVDDGAVDDGAVDDSAVDDGPVDDADEYDDGAVDGGRDGPTYAVRCADCGTETRRIS